MKITKINTRPYPEGGNYPRPKPPEVNKPKVNIDNIIILQDDILILNKEVGL